MGFIDTLNKTFVCGTVISAAYTQEVSAMPKKQVIANETAVAAPPARTAKPKTPRVKTSQHSKVASTDAVLTQTGPENPNKVIAQLAYSYWQSRGCRGGTALEDWVRAEQEYRQRLAAARL
jgi:hypothetical protein